MVKTALKRDALFPTKLKGYTRPTTILSYTTRASETSSGQGAFLEELVRAHHSLQGLAVSGQISPTLWASRKAFGVRFYFQTLNLSDRKDETDKKNQSLEERVVALFAAAQSASSSPLA